MKFLLSFDFDDPIPGPSTTDLRTLCGREGQSSWAYSHTSSHASYLQSGLLWLEMKPNGAVESNELLGKFNQAAELLKLDEVYNPKKLDERKAEEKCHCCRPSDKPTRFTFRVRPSTSSLGDRHNKQIDNWEKAKAFMNSPKLMEYVNERIAAVQPVQA